MAESESLDLERLERDSQRQIKKLRTDLEEKYRIHVPGHCDEFIQRCLRLKDFNQEKAFKLVKQFYDMMKKFDSWDVSLQPSIYVPLYDRKFCGALSQRDSKGRQIFIVKPAAWDPDEMNFDSAIAALWVMGQYASYGIVENQRAGVVSIWDFSGFTLRQAWGVKQRRLLDILLWVQNSVLCRFKAIHLIFHPRIVHVVHAFFKPFYSEKMRQRIHFHGSDVSSLHTHVDPGLLPVSLGGSINQENFFDKNFTDELLKQDSFFKEWQSCGFPRK